MFRTPLLLLHGGSNKLCNPLGSQLLYKFVDIRKGRECIVSNVLYCVVLFCILLFFVVSIVLYCVVLCCIDCVV